MPTSTRSAPRVVAPGAVIRPIALLGAVLVLLGAGLFLVASHLDAPDFVDTLMELFWLSSELNVWAWYGGAVLAVLAAAFALCAVTARRTGRPWVPDLIFTIVAVVLWADESAAIHERTGTLGASLGIGGTFAWIWIGIPVAVVVGALLLVAARRLDGRTRWRLVLAGFVYLSGALGFEALVGFLAVTEGMPGTHPLLVGITVLEESAEVAGVLIAVWAVLARLRITLAEGILVEPADAASTRAARGRHVG